MDQKYCCLWVLTFSRKTRNSKFFIVFVCRRTTSGENYGNIGSYLASKGPKSPQKGHFVDAESVRKTSKILNLIITNAVAVKLNRNYVSS